ncbi:polyketide synthase [Burkholderia gladioli]|uniref:polyketide synthase n=1 Tax=Burkholderia gladioli TaxID=28095 RepID=UPI002B24E3C2|nr:polyketide synthase [Burkholderia gladioli]MEB2549297.1 polyketide synthase [Burkholderia gladioli]
MDTQERVVELRELEAGVLQVVMQDRANKNTFSDALIRGLGDAFDAIRQDPHCKAVILTGYDNYFASGGTQDSLMYLSEGKGTFADIAASGSRNGINLYSLALNCPVPVISAMQGHGIGGGFVMGLFADFVVLGKECLYTTNFMKYGFTPGMGATLVLPQKLGLPLAQNMLMSARSFYGDKLQKLGVPFPVVPRAEVAACALEIARSLAEKPRFSLVTLKDHLVADLRTRLAGVIEQELVMHEKTFGQPEVRERIRSLFGQ